MLSRNGQNGFARPASIPPYELRKRFSDPSGFSGLSLEEFNTPVMPPPLSVIVP
jgi:hypothetical protein